MKSLIEKDYVDGPQDYFVPFGKYRVTFVNAWNCFDDLALIVSDLEEENDALQLVVQLKVWHTYMLA